MTTTTVQNGSASPAVSSTTLLKATPTAVSRRAPRSTTSRPTGSALSAAPARPTSPPTRTERREAARGLPPLELLVFAVGIATLGAEIAAARLMAPFFGASTIVWANTIAIVLVALSIGYWFGGRMADRRPTPARAVRDRAGGVGADGARAVRRRPVPLAQRRRVRLVLGRRVRGLAVRRARAGRGAGADARIGVAVGDPAEDARGRGLRADGRADVRDLDRRLAARHVPRLAAADPARRHAADVPDLRADHGGGRGARAAAAMGARAARDRGPDGGAGRHGQGIRARGA